MTKLAPTPFSSSFSPYLHIFLISREPQAGKFFRRPPPSLSFSLSFTTNSIASSSLSFLSPFPLCFPLRMPPPTIATAAETNGGGDLRSGHFPATQPTLNRSSHHTQRYTTNQFHIQMPKLKAPNLF